MKRCSCSTRRAANKEAISVGLVGNCADVLPEMVRRGIVPDVLTDQTSAHDALNGYVPNGMTLSEALQLRVEKPDEYVERSMAAMAEHVDAMLALQEKGAITFDYGNNIRTQAKKAGAKTRSIFQALCLNTSDRYFAKGKGRSVGLR